MLKDILLSMSIAIALCSVGYTKVFAQENKSPVVKILEPSTNTRFDMNTQVRYRIKVSDPEDGESEYDEIAANEIFLEVRYVPDIKNASNLPTADAKGLSSMKKSNCFNCHAFNGKLIAPSFFEIATRYTPTPATIDLLSKRILEGSGGVWGTARMPTHEDLTVQETQEIVRWILKNGTDSQLNYYTGMEGTIKIKSPDGVGQKGAFVLSATYSDHGSKNNPKQYLSSKDVIVLYTK
jgi:cytochrome c